MKDHESDVDVRKLSTAIGVKRVPEAQYTFITLTIHFSVGHCIGNLIAIQALSPNCPAIFIVHCP